MHVLIVSHNYPFEFDQTFGFFCKNQADALVSVNQKVGVICPLLYSFNFLFSEKKKLIGRSEKLVGNVLEYLYFLPSVPKIRRLRYCLVLHLGKLMVHRYIKKYGRPDIVHLHVYVAGELALYIKKKYGIPFVYTEHFTSIRNNQITPFEEKILGKISTQASARLAVSEHFCNTLFEKTHLPFTYLPNVYDSNIFTHKRLPKHDSEFIFLHVAHINARKNQRRLLAAFQLAFQKVKNVKLIIIGHGADQPEFHSIIHQFRLENQVSTHGSLSPTAVAAFMNSVNAFVMSSDYETFGVSIIEGMACGLPVVSTRSGGPESIITSRHLGELTELTEESLAEGMSRVYQRRSEYKPEEIAEYAYNEFSFEAIGKKLVSCYEKCIN